MLIRFNENINLGFPLRHPSCPGGNTGGEEEINRYVYLSMYPINLSEHFPWGTSGWVPQAECASDADVKLWWTSQRTLRLVAFPRVALCW